MKRLTVFAAFASALGFFLVGCLKFPLGDPQSSKIDPDLQGYWLAEDDSSASLTAIYPYDGHAYVMETFDFTKDQGERKFQNHQVYKAWLTDLKGHKFLTLDPLSQHLAPVAADRAYPLLRIDGREETRQVRAVDSDFPAFANAKSSADVAAIVTREIDNPKLYTDKVLTFRHLEPHADEAIIKSMTLGQ